MRCRRRKNGAVPGERSSIRWPLPIWDETKEKTVLVVVSLALSVTLFNALCAFVGGFSMEKYVSAMTCADFIVSTPDYFRYNLSADEFITQEANKRYLRKHKGQSFRHGICCAKPAYLWMTEDALRQDYARYEVLTVGQPYEPHGAPGDMVMERYQDRGSG